MCSTQGCTRRVAGCRPASMSPKPSNVPSPSMRAVIRRQRKVAENELAADIAADKVDEINATSLVEGSERTNRQVETGNEEVEGETPSDSFQLKEGSRPEIENSSSTNHSVDGAEDTHDEVAQELMAEDEREILSVMDEEGCAS